MTGANGQLGSEIKSLTAAYPEFRFTFIDIEDIDLTNQDSIRNYFADKDFNFLINCAAYTAVDKAESEEALSRKINADAVKVLAHIAAQKKIRMIHISTDYVFDGEFNQPIDEGAKPNPLSVYGVTKLEGEQHVQQILPDSYIIRTAWVYSSFGKNFVKTILSLARQREQLGIVSDQFGTPTYAHDLATAILEIIRSIAAGKQDRPGIYHFTNEGAASWYDFAFSVVNNVGLSCQINPIKTSEYPTAATRPKFSVLDRTKIKSTFGLKIPHWTTSLKTCLQRLAHDK